MNEQSELDKTKETQQDFLSDIAPREILELFFDGETFTELGGFMGTEKEPVELSCGYGLVNGSPVYAFSQGGAVGSSHVFKMRKVYDLALKTGIPIVGFYNSKGLYLSEGVSVLDAQGELILCQNNLSGVVPVISVVVGECVGANAVLACSADYLIMSGQGSFYSTPPYSHTSENVSTHKAAAQAGVADIITENSEEAVKAARDLISMHPLNYDDALPMMEFSEEDYSTDFLTDLSLDIDGLEPDEVLNGILDRENSIELLADFGTGAKALLSTIKGVVCGVIYTRGMKLTSDDCVKIAKLVQVWDSFGIPIITFVNTPGLAELGAASAKDFAKLSQVLAEATTVKIAVIIGKAYGAGYITLASRATNSDFTVAWPSALISPLPPETAVAFLEGGRITSARSREALEKEYTEKSASAMNAANHGIIDDVIMPSSTRDVIYRHLDILASKHIEKKPKKHNNIPF